MGQGPGLVVDKVLENEEIAGGDVVAAPTRSTNLVETLFESAESSAPQSTENLETESDAQRYESHATLQATLRSTSQTTVNSVAQSVLHSTGEESFEEAPKMESSGDESKVINIPGVKIPKVWAVAGGKGGVGKSLLCANFSIMLARSGRRVLAVDLDLGGSNLHTCMGVEVGKQGIGDWISGRAKSLQELVLATSETNLSLISGSSDPVNVIKKAENREAQLVDALRSLPYDDIVLDLGAGTQDSTVDFFISADSGLLSILPEPTSVENAYRFLRVVFLKRLASTIVPQGIRDVIEASYDQKNFLGIRTPADLMAVVERLDPVALSTLQKSIETFKPSIVINQVRTPSDIEVGKAICSVCRRYFGITVGYAGYLEYDNAVWKAVRSKKSVVHEFPTSILTSRFERISRVLTGDAKGLFP